MRLFRRGGDPRDFALAMIGLKMGDRLLQLGAGNGALLAALGSRVGLTGRACALDETDEGVARAQAAATREGVLLELQRGTYDALPFEAGSFDVVCIHGILPQASAERRASIAREAGRLLRSGGRCLILDPARHGLGALLGGRAEDPEYQPETLLRAAGFRAVRALAEGGGLRFVEGIIKH